MGVHGLWDLLAPVGRRVSVETLAGKRLAIDASIWMIQFMKAMRDEKGEMLRNAHMLGFFRRICKLLFLRTKPVFVFDGATPALKRRTVIARRRQRENAQAKIRKTAEKMLLNHVKAMRLKMLAADIKDQTAQNNSNGKEAVGNQSDVSRKNDAASEVHRQEMIDEMLVASILAEEGHSIRNNASSSAAAAGSDIDNASVSATTYQNSRSVTGNVEDQSTKSNSKGKEVMVDQSDMFGKDGGALKGSHQEMIDEMLAASILAEDCAGLDGNDSGSAAIGTDRHNASTSAAAFSSEYENEDSDEEMILPVSDGNVDPAVLAALPPSMQLDLLVQMRERLMAENRQRYQKVKKAPQKFSELQIEAYLKTVAFRREIDEVQRAASGRGVAGVQTSRIASEANREFIFSSSFSGDKQLLTSNQAVKDGEKLQNTEKNDSSLEVQNSVASATKFKRGAEPTSNSMGTAEDLVNDVQTFLDERGRRRVSRRRAMGIRMTSDLERNLDLLKEFELDISSANNMETPTTTMDGRESISKTQDEIQSFEDIDVVNVETMPSNSENSLLEAENFQRELSQKSDSCIKISFDDDGEAKSLDDEDELFVRLVAGESVGLSSAGKSASGCEGKEGNTSMDCGHSTKSIAENGDGNESDLEWEEAVIDKGNSLTNQNEFEANISHVEVDNCSDVEWEEGTSLVTDDKLSLIEAFNVEDCLESEAGVKCSRETNDFHKNASEASANIPITISKGSAEEEAALQEAIRRSLENLTEGKDSKIFHLEKCCNIRNSPESHLKVGSALQNEKPFQSFVDVNGSEAGREVSASISPFSHSRSDAAGSDVASEKVAVSSGTNKTSQIGVLATDACSASKHIFDEFTKEGAAVFSSTAVADVAMGQSGSVAEPTFCKETEKIIAKGNITPVQSINVHKSGNAVETSMSKHKDKDDRKDNVAPIDVQQSGNAAMTYMFEDKDTSSDFVGASLEDELSVLSQEYKNLGDEQRKLERNADSVNTEMFVECQELLQMFGLPYIIAPMEAEAQCAYMEIMNLVDGVVTDDSDVFLFGARSVYKNIFDDRKYVETYFMKDIESELGLSREKLIRMAMLLGSDYTEGISGIGIVNAIEVVNAFPEEDGLHKFREWIESPDPTILGKVGVQSGSSSKKRRSKASKGNKGDSKNNLAGNTSDCDALHENEENMATDDTTDIKQIFMEKHRNVSKNWHIPDSFPSDAVIHAYNSPQVDRSTELFAWGKPDIFALRRMCWEKFGWASQKADELLQPVLKEYNKHETQLRLEAFYTFNERFAKIRSKRIKQAVKGITGKQSLESVETDDLQNAAGATGKGKVHARNNSLRKNANPMESLPCEADERRLSGVGGRKVRSKQRQNSTRTTRRGRKMENLDLTDDETSSSHDEFKHEVQPEKVEFPANVRRSKRARKAANYVEKDEENEHRDSLNVSDHEHGERAKRKRSHSPRISSDDVTDFSPARGSTCLDPLTEDPEGISYLGEGGGFCANNDEEKTEDDDVFTKSPGGKQYLEAGGGFCVNEEDESTAAEISAEISTPLKDAGEMRHEIDQCESVISQASASHAAHGSNRRPWGGDKHETTHENLSNVVENVKEDDALSSLNAFSGIPYLKRKRRRT